MYATLRALWNLLKRIPSVVYYLLTLAFALGTFVGTLVLLDLNLRAHLTPAPPVPLAVLTCTTDGLPDLEVACTTRLSRNFHTGYIDFGDGSEPAIVEPDFWFASPSASREATHVKSIYHRRYKQAGDYRIELKLEGEVGNDATSKTVTVEESPSLAKGELCLTGLHWAIDESEPTRSRRYRIEQNQFEHDTSNDYTWRIESDQGWKFTKCEFEGATASKNAKYDQSDPFKLQDGTSEAGFTWAEFSFSLTSKGSLFGGRSAWFAGTAKCIQTPTDTGKEEKDGTSKELKILRYGIFEIDVAGAESVFESKRIKEWGIEHDKLEKVAGNDPLAPRVINLDCHRVALTLVDPPMLEWEDRLSKVWLKVAPLE